MVPSLAPPVRVGGEEDKMEQKNGPSRDREDQGVLATGVESATQATEKTLLAWFGFWRDVRGELAQRALSVIEWTEGAQQGATRVARSLVQRVDEVSVAWIDANERMALGVVRALGTTGQGASQLASRAAASLTSTRREVIAQA
jgi:hypothetical protein